MRLTILPEDVSFVKEPIPNGKLDLHGQREGVFVVSCKLPWGVIESRSANQGTAILALWESLRRDCDERGIELIWRAVDKRVLVLRGEVLQVLRNDGGIPVMVDVVLLEKPTMANVPVERLQVCLPGEVGEAHYAHSSFAVHLPYSELPNPDGVPYHKGKPKKGDRYILEFHVAFMPCSACGSIKVQGQPVLFVDKRKVESIWMLHYLAATYQGHIVNANEIMESLERLDLGRSASVQYKEMEVAEAEITRMIGSAPRLLRSPDGRYLPLSEDEE